MKLTVCQFALALLVVSAGAITAASAPASDRQVSKPQRNDPMRLWSEFPLFPSGQPQGPPNPAGQHQLQETSPQGSVAVAGPSEGSTRDLPTRVLYLLVAIGTGALAAFAVLFKRVKGGSNVGRLTNRLRPSGARSTPLDEPLDAESPVERIAPYFGKIDPAAADHDDSGKPIEDADQTPELAAEEPDTRDLVPLGAEVVAVLKSARDSAERIRNAARDDAEHLVADAKQAAETELTEARRAAEADRAESARVRAEADAYREETRAAADAYAEQKRREADEEAGEVLAEAEKERLEADAQVKRRAEEAASEIRRRHHELHSETAHFEQRLERMLAVFRGMSSQLEDLLEKRGAEVSPSGGGGEEEALMDALGPPRSTISETKD